MLQSMKRAARAVLALASTALALVSLASPALASSSSISSLAQAQTNVTTLVAALAGTAAVILVGICIWDFLKHRDIMRSVIELAAGVLMAAIALNASSVVTTLGISGAHF